jgi:hypothetical protein
MIMFCSGGELLSSESHSLFSFLKAIDSNNVLNISKISHPCLINGVRCNSNATNIVETRLHNMNLYLMQIHYADSKSLKWLV